MRYSTKAFIMFLLLAGNLWYWLAAVKTGHHIVFNSVQTVFCIAGLGVLISEARQLNRRR